MGKIVIEAHVVHRGKETFVTEGDMPPPERPKPRRQEGEQDHLQEGAGTTNESLEPGVEPAYEAEREDDNKGLVEKAKDKLKGK